MTADAVKVIAYIFWGLAGAFLVLSVYLYFRLKVRVIADDLSGRKAAREMSAYRENRKNDVHAVHAAQKTDISTTVLSMTEATSVLEQETEELSQTQALSQNPTEKTINIESSELMLNEMVIHTAERI